MSLRKQLNTAEARLTEIADELEAIGQAAADEGRQLNEADQKVVDALTEEFEQCEAHAKTLRDALQTKERLQAKKITPALLEADDKLRVSETPFDMGKLPARVRSQRSKVFESSYECYASGQWLLGIAGNANARSWCTDRGLTFENAMEGGTPASGGYTVPQPLAETIIRLVEEYGVFRQYARPAAMTSNTLDVPKRTDGLTVYYPGEGGAITPSDITFGQVNLVAVKYAQLAIMSSELSEDSVISMTDLIAQEMAWNFAFSEDKNSFLGDGTPTFGGITGIKSALLAGSRVTAGGNSLSAVTLDDFDAMVGKLPMYSGINPRWYMNSYVYHTVVVPLLTTLGGTDMRQVETGGELMLLGYPVTMTQVLPGAGAAATDMVAVFGDLALGAFNGTRRQITIRVLNELYAANDQIGLVGTMRADSKIHDTGGAGATESGSIIALDLSA